MRSVAAAARSVGARCAKGEMGAYEAGSYKEMKDPFAIDAIETDENQNQDVHPENYRLQRNFGCDKLGAGAEPPTSSRLGLG